MRRITSFKGNMAVVTGGSSGIGLETARALSAEGATVHMIARDPTRLRKASESVPGSIAHTGDVSDPGSMERIAAEVCDFGPVHILVNCAGMAHPGRFDDLDPVMARETISINLLGTMNSCRAFLPSMGPGGHIVNFGSLAGVVGIYGYSAYSASKFGIMGFSQALRMELLGREIGVSVIIPPDVDTPQLEYENRFKPAQTRRIGGMIEPVTADLVAKKTIEAIRRRRFVTVITLKGKFIARISGMAPGLTRWYLDSRI